jgi:hypothetical protein
MGGMTLRSMNPEERLKDATSLGLWSPSTSAKRHTPTSSSRPNQALTVAKDLREALSQSSCPLATIAAFSLQS